MSFQDELIWRWRGIHAVRRGYRSRLAFRVPRNNDGFVRLGRADGGDANLFSSAPSDQIDKQNHGSLEQKRDSVALQTVELFKYVLY